VLFSKRTKKSKNAHDGGELAPHVEQTDPVAVTRIQEALLAWATEKNAQTLAGVLRNCVTGELLLDISDSTVADPAQGFRPGDSLTIGFRTDKDERKLLTAFTTNERLATHRNGAFARSLVQPANAVMSQAAKEPYDGIVIDPGSETACIAYSNEIPRYLTEDPSLNTPLKAALEAPSLPREALLERIGATSTLFVAGTDVPADGTTAGGFRVLHAANAAGEPLAVAFTSPAEVWAWAPDYDARPTGVTNVAFAAEEDNCVGLLLNPAGPSSVVSLSELKQLTGVAPLRLKNPR
jgi:hypothetical protein